MRTKSPRLRKEKEKEKEKETEKEGILSESVMLPSGIRIGSVTILEVAGYGALPALQNLLDSALMEKNTNGLIDEQIVWVLHMILASQSIDTVFV